MLFQFHLLLLVTKDSGLQNFDMMLMQTLGQPHMMILSITMEVGAIARRQRALDLILNDLAGNMNKQTLATQLPGRNMPHLDQEQK